MRFRRWSKSRTGSRPEAATPNSRSRTISPCASAPEPIPCIGESPFRNSRWKSHVGGMRCSRLCSPCFRRSPPLRSRLVSIRIRICIRTCRTPAFLPWSERPACPRGVCRVERLPGPPWRPPRCRIGMNSLMPPGTGSSLPLSGPSESAHPLKPPPPTPYPGRPGPPGLFCPRFWHSPRETARIAGLFSTNQPLARVT